MKKILVFSLAYYPKVGGAEVSIKEITDRIPDIEFHMLTLRFSRADATLERVGRVNVHRIGGGSYVSKMFFPLTAARAARALHRTERFDAAWAMMSYMLLPIIIAGLGIPYALTLQEGDTEAHMFGRLRILPVLPLLRKGFREARTVSALSTFLALWAKGMGYPREVTIVPQGTNVQAFDGEQVAHEGIVLVSTSRLVHKNALDDVIRALAYLPEVRFVNYGFGPDKEKLQALASELGVRERVELLPHPGVPELPPYLHRADVFIRPSRSEGFGISFLEAMAAGLPVIATCEGGLSDFITHEVAWPVRPDAPEDIATAVRDILADPAKAAHVVENAKHMVREKYEWDFVARDMREKIFTPLFMS